MRCRDTLPLQRSTLAVMLCLGDVYVCSIMTSRMAWVRTTMMTTAVPSRLQRHSVPQVSQNSFDRSEGSPMNPWLGDVFVSILPCWHIFERTAEYFTLTRGVTMVHLWDMDVHVSRKVARARAVLHFWVAQGYRVHVCCCCDVRARLTASSISVITLETCEKFFGLQLHEAGVCGEGHTGIQSEACNHWSGSAPNDSLRPTPSVCLLCPLAGLLQRPQL